MNKKEIEIKVGDYVRLDRCQGINKIDEYDEYTNEYILEDIIGDEYGDETWILNKEDIIKISSDIIDLIEIGDYVNGYLVTLISKDAYGRPLVFVGQRYVEENGFYRSYYNQEIKSIVTKEQFNQMEYKI